MEWRDQGSLLTVRRHGEAAAIIEVFTRNHGRHAGIVRGGTSRKLLPVLQPGAQLDLEWHARLEEHLGTFRVEPLQARAAYIMDNRLALAGLNAICGLLRFALPEREPYAQLYLATQELLDILVQSDNWLAHYVTWELLLLKDMGFALDLESCAATGVREGLLYVSPRTGRAISAQAAGDWAGRLLPFPTPDAISTSLQTTGYFLEHRLAASLGSQPLPKARSRLLALIEKQAEQKAQ